MSKKTNEVDKIKTYYGNLCTWFYDIDKPFAPKEELDFYMSYMNLGMLILEPMCGSGRFMIEFIKGGFTIDGFDLSADMIDRCEAKIKHLHHNGRVYHCNFSHFKPNKRYDCIYIAACSFSLIIEDNEILSQLVQLKNLLKPDGKILLAVLTDLNYRKDSVEANEKTDMLKRAKENDAEIVFKSTTSYDAEKSVTYSQMTYELFLNNEFIRSEQEDFYIKRYRAGEFEEFAANAGFHIESAFINYNKEEFHGQDTEMVVYVLSK